MELQWEIIIISLNLQLPSSVKTNDSVIRKLIFCINILNYNVMLYIILYHNIKFRS